MARKKPEEQVMVEGQGEQDLTTEAQSDAIAPAVDQGQGGDIGIFSAPSGVGGSETDSGAEGAETGAEAQQPADLAEGDVSDALTVESLREVDQLVDESDTVDKDDIASEDVTLEEAAPQPVAERTTDEIKEDEWNVNILTAPNGSDHKMGWIAWGDMVLLKPFSYAGPTFLAPNLEEAAKMLPFFG